MSISIILSNTDEICVAIRKIAIMGKEENHIKTSMEMLGFDEHTAERFDWFCKTISNDGILCSEAVAAAWVANELFGNDGVNSPEDAFEIAPAVDECECGVHPEDGSTIQACEQHPLGGSPMGMAIHLPKAMQELTAALESGDDNADNDAFEAQKEILRKIAEEKANGR
jgi:hypothetical protein